jgi:rhodanese-related sulfurtransferase
MLNILKSVFSPSVKTDYQAIISQGAQILDVRTPSEFRAGHIKGAVNIPLQQLAGSHSKLRKDKPVITCCASGVRSSSALSILRSNGFTEVYNGGGWQSLQREIQSEKN